VVSREKKKLAASGNASGRAVYSALRSAWQGISSGRPAHGHEDHVSLRRDFTKRDCPTELLGAMGILRTIRQRILANSFLRGLTKWWTWIFAGLIVIGALSAKFAGAMILAVVLAVAGAVFILAWIFRTRLTLYDTACRLDSAAGLQDRISTAIFLADIKNPDEMMQYQRRDAVKRLEKVEPRGLFPVRMPATAGRVLILFLAAAGLYAYRLHHRAPLTALLQSTARSQLVQSILSPIVRTLENELQRTAALADSRPDPAPDEVRPADPAQNADDLWQNGDDKGTNVQEEQEAVAAMPQDQMQAPGDQEGADSQDADQPGAGEPSEDLNANETAGKQGDQQSGENKSQSMSQSLMQALKNMMPSPPGQQSNNRSNQQQPPNSQGMPQSGNSNQPGTTPADQRSDSRGSSDARQKSSENSSSGAGNQDGTKELKSGLESRPVKAVPDRVALAPSGFKDPTRVRNNTETGTAGLAVGNAAPQAVAVINGAEQEDIPARYRLYVQHYFEHPDNGPATK
jgi:hypothetical protein